MTEAIQRDTTELPQSTVLPVTEQPKEIQKYKCHTCFTILKESDLTKDKWCPVCGEKHLEKMCSADHECTCIEEITYGLNYCPKCGQPICPCGCHDTFQVSRVTGYMANVESFNNGKKQELKDRRRYTPA